MSSTLYASEEIVRRGQELYEERIRPNVEAEHKGKHLMVLEEAGAPLAGMSLLYGSRVTLQIVDGGDVTIEPLP
jgi:hypothetical protein